MATFHLIYPENCIVTVEWILSHGFDAAVNSAVDEHVREHGVFERDEDYEAFAAGITAPGLDDSIELLEDLGLCTFGQQLADDGLDFEDDRKGAAHLHRHFDQDEDDEREDDDCAADDEHEQGCA